MSEYDLIYTDDGLVAQSVHYANGYAAGRAAGGWVIDGNTTEEVARRILQGLTDCDPEVMDLQPAPLSGEWAGESMVELLGDDYTDEDADEYEIGFSAGFWAEVVTSCMAIATLEGES